MAEIELQKRVVYAGDVHIALLKSGWSIREACDFVNGLPKADVAPVRHGEWDDSGRYTFPGGSIAVRCSECGCALTAGEYRLNTWNFCPVCGADMRGANDEQL